MSKLQNKVLALIRQDPRIADNDDDLIASVWRASGWNDRLSLEENLRNMPQPESITRCRRKLHEEGKITYSDEADKRREQQYREHTDKYSKPQAISWLDD